jgi:hypothetical protein
MPAPGVPKVRRRAADGATAGTPPLRYAPGGAPLRRVGRPLGHRTAASYLIPASSPNRWAQRFAAFAGLPPTASGLGLRQKGMVPLKRDRSLPPQAARISRADNKEILIMNSGHVAPFNWSAVPATPNQRRSPEAAECRERFAVPVTPQPRNSYGQDHNSYPPHPPPAPVTGNTGHCQKESLSEISREQR